MSTTDDFKYGPRDRFPDSGDGSKKYQRFKERAGPITCALTAVLVGFVVYDHKPQLVQFAGAVIAASEQPPAPTPQTEKPAPHPAVVNPVPDEPWETDPRAEAAPPQGEGVSQDTPPANPDDATTDAEIPAPITRPDLPLDMQYAAATGRLDGDLGTMNIRAADTFSTDQESQISMWLSVLADNPGIQFRIRFTEYCKAEGGLFHWIGSAFAADQSKTCDPVKEKRLRAAVMALTTRIRFELTGPNLPAKQLRIKPGDLETNDGPAAGLKDMTIGMTITPDEPDQ